MLRLCAASYDLLALILCWWLAYLLRFNLVLPPEYFASGLRVLPAVVITHAVIYQVCGLYRGIWRYASLRDLLRILIAVTTGALVVVFFAHMLNPLETRQIPRSVLLLHPLLLVLVMGGGRFLYRLVKDWRQYGHLGLTGEWVLIVGAGYAGARLAQELRGSTEWRAAGFLDDDSSKRDQEIHGIRVRGPIRKMAYWARKLDIRHVIIAMPGVPLRIRQRAMETAVQAGLQVLSVPAAEDLLARRVTISRLRRVQLEDLLKRDPVQLDTGGLAGMLTDQVVLITGAGGSIGSELARQIAGFQPRALVLLEHSEFALFQIEQEFRRTFPELAIHPVIGDVKDACRLEQVFSAWRPALVFHAAAYKHVPLMETGNAREAVRNNVTGTAVLAAAALRHQVKKMVLISTDKAVNPVNVMGASKRIAEMLVSRFEADARVFGAHTCFLAVRFGNVLGSNGSVISTFERQIAKGGPVTVTHPDILRYFMLIPEAAQLVLQAALMGKGGEIFVLDMGEPIKILDLARDMILLSGHSEAEIPIQITGLRPGEKLYEELLADDETSLPTPHPKLRISKAATAPPVEWRAELETWLASLPLEDTAIRAGLARFAPEYQPAALEEAAE
ncbi:MAG: polysaccharide biosynthesis protein [Zoogloeaceae bacterium]|nr:polysaccharide biosynthesis protein [Zoogloeaceae bacterium]